MIGRGGRWNELLASGPHAPIAPLSAAMTQIAYIMRWICGRATAIPKCASPYPFLISLEGRPTMNMAPYAGRGCGGTRCVTEAKRRGEAVDRVLDLSAL